MPWLNIAITLFSTTLFIALAAILMFRRGWILLPSEKDQHVDSSQEELEFNRTTWAFMTIGTIIIVIALYIFLFFFL